MLDSNIKQKALRAIYRSGLKRSQKRDLASKVTSRSATPQSVGGLLTAAGLGSIAAGIFGFAHVVNESSGRNGSTGGDNFSDLDPSVDATQNPDGSHNENPIGIRVPVDNDNRNSDSPYRHVGSDGVSWFDPDTSHGPSLDHNGNPRQISTDRPGNRNHMVDTDGDGVVDTNSGSLDNDNGLFSGLGLSGLIDAIANRFLDFELTGGEREANEFTAEQNRLANEFSAQQAEISRDWQEQMYQKYNSLQGKIAQAEEAGVNPMFALGSGVTPTGFSSSSPTGHAGSSVGASPALNGQLPALLQSFLGIAKVKSEIKKTEAETRQFDTQTDISLQKLSYELNNLQSSTDLNIQKAVESATSVEKMKADIGLTNEQAEVAVQQVHYLIAQTNYLNAIQQPDVRLKRAQAIISEWQEKNKELFKGLDIGMDAVNTLVNLGIGIFNAKTGRMFTQSPVVVPKDAQVFHPSDIAR